MRDEKLRQRLGDVLETGEQIQVAVSGMCGTLSRGSYGNVAFNAPTALDPYHVALTETRLVAVRAQVRAAAERVSLESTRATAHIDIRRRLGLFDWVAFVFHDRELRLLVPGRSREQLRQIAAALGDATATL